LSSRHQFRPFWSSCMQKCIPLLVLRFLWDKNEHNYFESVPTYMHAYSRFYLVPLWLASPFNFEIKSGMRLFLLPLDLFFLFAADQLFIVLLRQVAFWFFYNGIIVQVRLETFFVKWSKKLNSWQNFRFVFYILQSDGKRSQVFYPNNSLTMLTSFFARYLCTYVLHICMYR
jgi:hypothetical protein